MPIPLSNTASVTSNAIDTNSTNDSATVNTVASPPVEIPSLTLWGLIGTAGVFALLLLSGIGRQAA